MDLLGLENATRQVNELLNRLVAQEVGLIIASFSFFCYLCLVSLGFIYILRTDKMFT
jgi:hypothetical protein